jgi:uncharacterized membrane protein YgdD (TMEM256/DUF423 family)
MSSQTLIRLGSLALISAGVLAIGYALIAPDETAPGVFQHPNFVIGNVLNTVRWILMPFGLVALYLRQGHQKRALNLTAFVLSFVAIVLTVGLDIDKTFILPYMASLNPGTTSMADFASNMPTSLQPYLVVLMTSLALHLVGLILLGVAVVRSGVLPQWAGWLLIVGTVFSYGSLFGSNVAHTVGVVMVGIALAWLGAALWSRQSEASGTMQPLLAK